VNTQSHPVGVIRLSFHGQPIWLVELRLLAIGEPRRGFGAEAMRWAQNYAFRTIGAHRMYLEVAAHNATARALYERCGFVQEGLWREGFRDNEGAYHDLAGYGMLDREYFAIETGSSKSLMCIPPQI
jgi:RimJ/RimL family protein N-acetyltransferase